MVVVSSSKRTVKRWVGRSKPGPWIGLVPKPDGSGLEIPTLRETGLVDPSNGGKIRFSRFCTWAGPP